MPTSSLGSSRWASAGTWVKKRPDSSFFDPPAWVMPPEAGIECRAMSTIEALRIPIWRESLVAFERTALMRSEVWAGEAVPHGDGTPVMLIPGFLAGDMSLGLM